jgi:hypothetical protein
VLVVLVVVVFGAVVVCFVVTGGVRAVEVDFVVVVVTGATGATDVLVVTAGVAVVTAVAVLAVVVVELWVTGGFLWWAFLWCTRLWVAAAADEVELDVVVEDVELVGSVVVLEPPEPPALPHPTIARPAITVTSAAFIRPTPLVALSLGVKANNG